MVTTFQPTTASAAVEGLPQVFDPGAATGVEVVVLFDLYGREPGQWTVVIRDGTCRVMGGRPLEPTIALTIDSDLWLAIARGERTVEDVVRAGDCQVSGATALVAALGRLFPVA